MILRMTEERKRNCLYIYKPYSWDDKFYKDAWKEKQNND